MAINEWWAGDASERYWLEITDRESLGDDLHAPKSTQSGDETWSYSLVSYVRDGDIVFHYWKQAGQQKAIVGYSRATGALESDTIRWQSHGTYGRATEPPTSRPAWRFPLSEFTDLTTPVTLEHLRALEAQIRTLSEDLAHTFDGPLYLPFVFSDKRPLRTAQGYLTKLPASFVKAIPGLGNALQVPAPQRAKGMSVGRQSIPTGGTGYQSDPKVRSAIERHAVDWALRFFKERGYLVEDVGNFNPYDVRATKEGSELHVEVKGSAGTGTTVEVTAGEVKQATTNRNTPSTLFVVDQIQWSRASSGVIATKGGRLRVWKDWEPEEERLTPTSFRYLLPPGGEDTDF
jgi:hypothetical protein